MKRVTRKKKKKKETRAKEAIRGKNARRASIQQQGGKGEKNWHPLTGEKGVMGGSGRDARGGSLRLWVLITGGGKE